MAPATAKSELPFRIPGLPAIRAAVKLAEAVKGFDGASTGDPTAPMEVPGDLWNAWVKLAKDATHGR